MSPVTLQISAGTGPVEARRFVALLAKHLATRCSELGASPSSVGCRGPEDAPASVILHFHECPPSLHQFVGTHALILKSQDRGRRSRKRWFAGVTLAEDSRAMAPSVSFSPEDIRVTACRAGGPGGQHVNKTSSAVRVVHPASGFSVRASSERSQHQNLRIALDRLAAMLGASARRTEDEKRASQRLAHYMVVRGQALWTYELTRGGELSDAT